MSNAKARITRDPADNLTPADARDLAEFIAFALRFEDRKRKHDTAEYTAAIAAERVVRHLERVGFVVMKKPPYREETPYRWDWKTRQLFKTVWPAQGVYGSRSRSRRMAVKPRYLVETGANSVETAFNSLTSLCAKHRVARVTLVVPKKQGWDHSVVAKAVVKFLGQATAKALLKGAEVPLGQAGLTLTLESQATFSASFAPGLIVGAHISDGEMAKIDDAPNDNAILYIPWTEVEGRRWQATWQPETIGPSTWKAPAAALPNDVEDALMQLTQSINLGTGLNHPSGKALARSVIARLQKAGHSLDPAEIKRWALRHSWSSGAAAELETIAKKGGS